MLKIYRADRKGNQTMPEKYHTEGLLTKQVNSGDHPLPHQKYGWLKTITNHINYKNPSEKYVYDRSQYLSFTTDINRAFHFLATRKGLKYLSSDRQNATAYIFNATIETSGLQERGEGVYMYSYKCNYERAITDAKFKSGLSAFIKCNICAQNKEYNHELLLIDAERYLRTLKSTYPIEYANALRDKEWLLMPYDPMIGINAMGYQSRIPIADFWTVDFYKFEL